MKQGTINSEALTPFENRRGWNKVVSDCGFAIMRLREMQEDARAAKDYDAADKLRAIADRLENSISFFAITYTEGDKSCGAKP